ncbi:MAG: energy-coupling factor ABC transporter permease [Actinomycetota bacterium]|nr:energy-coupling factor ABC transporter permease [Actinomycetota bacterium]
MHIPDGFINVPTSLGAGAMAAGALGLSVKRAGIYLQDKHVPLAGLMAAFLFTAQMINFPIAAGTSGHLIGGVLAAVLLGPWMAVLCMSVVVGVQALFADGGLTALGLNVLNLAVVGCVLGYGIFWFVRLLAPRNRSGVVFSAGLAATLSVVASAALFVFEYGVGGDSDVDIAAVLGAMLGIHLFIGVVEGLVTAATLSLVIGVRPDLVFGAAGLVPGAGSNPVALPVQLRQ